MENLVVTDALEAEKNCFCKGIRTCLICENEGKVSRSCEENKVVDQYRYCSHCNLCWPVGTGASPLYLGRMTVVPDFITEEEEADMIAAIDSIQWMPSQSGRKKQDFGPKVNFKKMKAKIGEFKGFPLFTENLTKRLVRHKDLSDFKPVELCHLDYDPQRGSAIEPHIDDSWIWGERLVTINLASPTVLTFTPAKLDADCDCRRISCCSSKVLSLQTIEKKEHCQVLVGNDSNDNLDNKDSNDALSCSDDSSCHLNSEDIASDGCNVEALSSIKSSNEKRCINKVTSGGLLSDQVDCLKTSFASNSKDMCTICDCHTWRLNAVSLNDGEMKENRYCDYTVPARELANTLQHTCAIHSSQVIKTQNEATIKERCNCKIATDCALDRRNNSTCNSVKDSQLCNHKDSLGNHLNCPESISISDMCTEYRIGQKTKNIEVLVPLPPRSLVVVAGCCRHNWFHEIKRKDIVSRRLAMTFRELSWNFMAGGPNQGLGAELLELGATFFD